jgi:signal transduction histidine kinase
MIHVLHAEDEPQVAEVVRVLCAELDPEIEIEHVPTGWGCLARMARGGIDVLIVDLVLPDLDGLAILGQLAASGDLTPVIMASGHGHTELAVKALRAGAVDCIEKNSAEFFRLPEIIRRAHEGRPVRRSASIPTSYANVLLVDRPGLEWEQIASFFSGNAPSFHLETVEPAALEAGLGGEHPCDGLVIGSDLGGADPLLLLRRARTFIRDLPVIVVAQSDVAPAVAAFKLGAHDFLVHGPGWLQQLVFSLNNALRRGAAERMNARLTAELAELNQSLEKQVAARTHELEAMSHRLLRVQEAERRAIARELHDQVGQVLTALKFQLEAAQSAPVPGPLLAEAKAMTQDLLQCVRELTRQLRPQVLDDLGLRPAIEWHAGLFSKQTGVAVETEVSLPSGRLPEELETAVFRVVQEALTNVARHSGAKSAVVTITAGADTLHAEISDSGHGFDSSQARAPGSSLGLTVMAERVSLAGGRLEVVSQPGRGTRVSAEFPLTAPLAAPKS